VHTSCHEYFKVASQQLALTLVEGRSSPKVLNSDIAGLRFEGSQRTVASGFVNSVAGIPAQEFPSDTQNYSISAIIGLSELRRSA
jgi:hypothetical protein